MPTEVFALKYTKAEFDFFLSSGHQELEGL